MTVRSAFALGYEVGSRYGEQSAREAVVRFPMLSSGSLESYLQGSIDGQAGDTWRLHYGLAAR